MISFFTSTQKLDFLGVFGLTTVGRRDEIVHQKRRKRRRMLRERSPSPPASQSKRTPPPAQLSTRFTPEEMDRAPELEDKKRFLTMFRLSHVTVQQRRGMGIHSITQMEPSLWSCSNPLLKLLLNTYSYCKWVCFNYI